MFLELLLLFSHVATPRSLVSATAVRESKPTVKLTNGSYYGLYNDAYKQDFFLGMPYAQPPVDDLRFRLPQSLNTTWKGVASATEYGYECNGFGSDQWLYGNWSSEDCLTINVVRPSGISEDEKLPVAVWIHGGGFVQGGSLDPKYNLSFIVNQSTAMDTPMIGVSFNYRLSIWGSMLSQEVLDEGVTNLNIRDQRLALYWIQENIAAFGGDPAKVTIWGQSAGGFSVGTHLVAYGGRDDMLFRGAISQSGAIPGVSRMPTLEAWQPSYDALVNQTGCSRKKDTLACLRKVPASQLTSIVNASTIQFPSFIPYVDGDILQQSGVNELRAGHFVHVPYMLGTTADDYASFINVPLNTTEQFIEGIKVFGVQNSTAHTIAALYPDIPRLGLPSTLEGHVPDELVARLGYAFKREAAFVSDVMFQAGRRMTSEAWAAKNLTAYTYVFDVLVNGMPYYYGSGHFDDVAFVLNNIEGEGYGTVVTAKPFENQPETFVQLSNMMSRMWISFVAHQDPNKSGATNVTWPRYNLGKPENIVFDVNKTSLATVEPDVYRAEAIRYISDHLATDFGY